MGTKKKGVKPKSSGETAPVSSPRKKSCIYSWGVQTWIEIIILTALAIMIVLAVLELFL